MSKEPASQRLPDALERYAEIERRLGASRPAVFLDYDGTLAPIAPRPELAVLSEEMRDAIRALSGLCPVAIVSGRDRADVEKLVALENLIYAGSHGFDIAGPGGLRQENEEAAAFQPALTQADASLRAALDGIPGALIERKRFAIAVHYRLVAPERVEEIGRAVDTAVAETGDRLRRTGGKMIFELRPRFPWDKGRALLWLLEAMGLDRPDVLPVYLGDDETDEDAFAVLRDLGIGVLVGSEPQATAALYVLRDPDEAGRFLRRMIQTLETART